MVRLAVPIIARLVLAVAALAVAAVGVLVCVEVVAAWTTDSFVVLPADWPDQLRSTDWSEPLPTTIAAGIAAVGAVLLLVAIWPRPPLTVAAAPPGMRIERHALERSIGRELDRVDGVSAARVRAGVRRVRVRVDTTRRLAPDAVRVAAERVVADIVERHGLALRPSVSLRRRGGPR